MSHAIEIDRLTKVFRSNLGKKNIAVADVSFAMRKGETVGLIGQNGAGKTTTIKSLLGFIFPTSGTCRIMGIPSTRPESRRRLGFAPENPAFYDALTPLQSMRSALNAYGRRGNSDQIATKWLERLNIAHAANRPIRFLSKGMTQRLALAQALAIEPEVLVLDEPLSGLDPGGRMEVVDVLQDYRRQGGAILFSSHVLFDVERLADRFVMIDRGHLVADMGMADLEKHTTRFGVRISGRQQPSEDFRREGADRWVGEVPREHLDHVLAQFLARGLSIIEVRSLLNLETMYARLVQEGNSPHQN